MLRKHLSLFLALLMIFTVIPETSLAENGVDEPESPTSIGFLNADSCDEAFVYHYTVEASPGDTIMLAPEPDYNGDGCRIIGCALMRSKTSTLNYPMKPEALWR